MDRTPDVPLLRTETEVADYRTDKSHTWDQLCAAHDKLRERIGVREGDRLWNRGGFIASLRSGRPGCAVGWCAVCGDRYTLIDQGCNVPAHIWPRPEERYDRLCPGSGTKGLDHKPHPYELARRVAEADL